MPYKPGGGNQPELYNPKNGEYTDEEKSAHNKNDLESLVMNFLFGLKDANIKFPNSLYNDKEYCNLYIKYLKSNPIFPYIGGDKTKYLLTYQEKNDKSVFLKQKLGYSEKTLYEDILNNTDFKSMMHSDLTQYGLKVIACTILKSQFTSKRYYVTSVWIFKEPQKAQFVTLYPGGEDLWNLFYSKK